jgi:4-amino-4-deoxy-L-arabinose transferase-like glycosyltransferase
MREQAAPPRVSPELGTPRVGKWWRWLEPVGMVVLALALNLAGNDRTGLWDRDEPRYAVSVREMRQRGDWLSPSFNGEPRYHKPILIYWLMGVSTALAGDNPFGARLVSAIAGASTVLGVWFLGRRMLGPAGARLAALVFATAPIAVAEAKLATTDATLALLLLGCQLCLERLGRRASPIAAGCFWACLALAILTKGPIGPALVVVSSLLAWWLGWPGVPWRRLHWRGGLAGLVVVTAPWYIAITIASHGEFLRFAVGKQIVHRLASDMEDHGGFPGYYPVVATVVFYPWSALLPAALIAAWSRRRSNPNLGFLLGWVIGPLVLLECFRTKLIHYYLPAFPACALLVAWLILSVAAEGVNIRRWPFGRLAMALLVAIGIGGCVILAGAATVLPEAPRVPIMVVTVVLAIGTLAALSWFQQGATKRAAHALVLTWAVIIFVFGGWIIPLAEPYRTSRIIGEKLASLSAKFGVEPVLLEYQEPGVVYSLGRPIATTRDRDGFFSHLTNGRSVLTVALPSEIEVMREHFGLDVTPVDEVDGIMINKGTRRTFQLAIARPAALAAPERPLPPHTRRVGLKLEQTDVK